MSVLKMPDDQSKCYNWLETVKVHGKCIEPELLQKWSEEISKRYSMAGRYYHTVTHLSDMMNHFDAHRKDIQDQASVTLAILFHDIVYDPKSKTNEVDSVPVFQQFSADVNLDKDTTERVKQMILATIKHVPDGDSPDNSDLAYFLDFDMAILGHSDQEYDKYADNIFKEYSHMTKQDFCNGRANVLKTFLTRPRIYATDTFHTLYDNQARNNLKREIAHLETAALQSVGALTS